MTAKKITRKELLKKPDEFLTFVQKASLWIREHFRLLGFSLLALLVIIAGYFSVRAYLDHQERKASRELVRIQNQFLFSPAPKIPEAVKAFQVLAGKYPRTHSALFALIYVGNLQYQEKDFKKAAESYGKLLKTGLPSGDLEGLVRLSLTYSLEEAGQPQEAVKAVQPLTEPKNTFFREQALLCYGRLKEKEGDPKGALWAYQELAKQFPQSAYRTMVQEKAAGLTVKNP